MGSWGLSPLSLANVMLCCFLIEVQKDNTIPQGFRGVLALGMWLPWSEEAQGPHGEEAGSTPLVELPAES